VHRAALFGLQIKVVLYGFAAFFQFPFGFGKLLTTQGDNLYFGFFIALQPPIFDFRLVSLELKLEI
jgi:hypothetical protein